MKYSVHLQAHTQKRRGIQEKGVPIHQKILSRMFGLCSSNVKTGNNSNIYQRTFRDFMLKWLIDIFMLYIFLTGHVSCLKDDLIIN